MRGQFVLTSRDLGYLAVICLVCFFQAQAQTQILNNGNFMADPACGSTKVCFSDCDSSDGCTYEAACAKVATNAECTVTVKSDITGDAWIALAFSKDRFMGQDSVTGCKRRANVYTVFNALNTGRSPPTMIASDGSTLDNSSTQGNVMSCSFTRVLVAGLNGQRFDLNQNYYWMVARGTLSGAGVLGYHTGMGRFVSSQELDLSASGVQVTQAPTQSITPSILNNGNFMADPACGSTKVCFSDCDSSNGCTYEAACAKVATNAKCTVKVKSDITGDAWIALAFSTDRFMGQDSVTGCKRRANVYTVFNAFNTGRSTPTMIASDGSTLDSSFTQGNVMSCSFTRVLAAGLNGQRFDLNQNYYWMVARGTLSGAGVLSYHTNPGRFVSSQELDLSASGVQVTQAPTGTTTPSVSGSLAKSPDCGSTKGCFSECDAGGTCTFTVQWSLDAGGATATYTLSSDVSANSYIALGFSGDNKMGDDDVIGCVVLADGTVTKFSGQNTGQSPPTIFADSNLVLVNGELLNGALTCNLRRPVQNYTVSGRTLRNIDEKWILLFARGSASIQNGQVSVGYHGATNRFFTAQPLAASDTGDTVAKEEDFPLIKLHGALMIGAWVFLASLGIVAARYYKPVWKQDLCSLKVWFQIHRTCMILAFCCCVAGFVVIFVEVEEWIEIEQTPKYLQGHPIMGVIVTALCVINPLMALIRPHPGTTYRPLFNWAHWFVGTGAHVLGVITIFFGFELDKADAPDYLKYILAGYAGWQALVELTLEMMSCCCKRTPRSEVYKMSDNGVQRETDSDEETDGMDSVRKAIYVLHFFVITAISAVLIGLLVVGKKELDK